MYNYIKADFYRIFAKKGIYIYFIIVIGLMMLGLYTASSSISSQTMAFTASFAFTIFGTFASGYLFSTIYNDDLTAKTLPSIIGFGKKRGAVVLSKLFINIVLTVLVFFIAFACYCLLLMVLGFQLTGDQVQVIAQMASMNVLKGVAIGAVASVIAYGLQKSTPAIVVFILASTGFFGPLITAALGQLKLDELSQYLIDPILNQIMKSVSVESVLPYLLYVAIFTALAIAAFKQRDLDF